MKRGWIMLNKKCRLCGGRLVNNRCTFCGLDNSIYDRENSRQSSSSQPQSKSPPAADPVYHMQEEQTRQHTASRAKQKNTAQKQKAVYAGRQTASGSLSRRPVSAGRNRGWLVWIIIIAVILFALLPALTDNVSGIFGNTYSEITDDSDYDPYAYVTREIPADGEIYETVLSSGIYRVGVHIPEGIYHAELVEGAGSIEINDDENSIYHYVTFGTDSEYGQVTEDNDIRLYNGADLNIDSGVVLRFTTDNAQPLTQETKENPLSEPVSLEPGTYICGDGIIPEGIYDITSVNAPGDDYGYSNVTLTYPNGSYEYLWIDSPDYSPVSDEYADTGTKNIVIPDGTEVSVEYGSVNLTPSDGYYDVDYTEYTSD